MLQYLQFAQEVDESAPNGATPHMPLKSDTKQIGDAAGLWLTTFLLYFCI